MANTKALSHLYAAMCAATGYAVLSDVLNVSILENVLLALALGLTATVNHVLHVVSLRTCKEMRWVNARRVVACMPDHHAFHLVVA
ncbi:TPA: hypothetical protein QCH88_004308 [Enterobacter asburiae]|nr:hypothetical protein [Enterobacter asburiae]